MKKIMRPINKLFITLGIVKAATSIGEAAAQDIRPFIPYGKVIELNGWEIPNGILKGYCNNGSGDALVLTEDDFGVKLDTAILGEYNDTMWYSTTMRTEDLGEGTDFYLTYVDGEGHEYPMFTDKENGNLLDAEEGESPRKDLYIDSDLSNSSATNVGYVIEINGKKIPPNAMIKFYDTQGTGSPFDQTEDDQLIGEAAIGEDGSYYAKTATNKGSTPEDEGCDAGSKNKYAKIETEKINQLLYLDEGLFESTMTHSPLTKDTNNLYFMDTTATGLDKFEAEDPFNAYPNPFGDDGINVTIGKGPGNVRIVLYDGSGKRIRSYNFSRGGSYNISGDGLAPGPYLMELTDGRHAEAIKLIKN